MREKNKKIVSVIIIIVLLPYILTVFIKGESSFVVNSSSINQQVTVLVDETEISITWEEYLIGILAREIPEDYSLEAMKAQAIIIRTRLALESASEQNYIFQDEYYTTESIQSKWGDRSVEMYTNLVEAIDKTDGMTLTYQGELISTPYHRLNTGMTRNGNEVFDSDEYSYLITISCPLDLEAEEEIAIQTVSYEELEELVEAELGIRMETELIYDDISITSLDEARYVLSVEIQGNEMSGEAFRSMLDLKSSSFSFQEEDGKLKITTEGVGHGLGLSQNTAHYMGLEGKTYEEIIAYFYSGTEIVKN